MANHQTYHSPDHTDVIHHEDPTIRCCWDGDRLDLTRVGMNPDPEYLNTETAKRLADGMEGDDLETVMNWMVFKEGG